MVGLLIFTGLSVLEGKRTDALCLGSKAAGLYAVMTNRDTTTSMLLLTVGRCVRYHDWTLFFDCSLMCAIPFFVHLYLVSHPYMKQQ